MRIELRNEAATARLAGELHALLPADVAGWTILLDGELGAGKSTFARALLRAMGCDGPVPSPTYTLVEPYELPAGTVYHVDLYRVSSADELRYLGWNELDHGLRLVEWPDRAPALADEADVQIRFDYAKTGRVAAVSGLSPRGRQLVVRLAAAKTQVEN